MDVPIPSRPFGPIVEAYDRLDYDLGVLAPRDERVLEAKGLKGPDGWIRLSREVQALTYPIKGSTLGVVVFPAIRRSQGSLPESAARGVREACRDLDARCELVLGISPWGYRREKRFLQQESPALDILLGGGQGRSVRSERIGATLWLRPYARGKVVHAVTVPHWGEGRRKERDAARKLRARMKVLRERIRPDPEIARLLR